MASCHSACRSPEVPRVHLTATFSSFPVDTFGASTPFRALSISPVSNRNGLAASSFSTRSTRNGAAIARLIIPIGAFSSEHPLRTIGPPARRMSNAMRGIMARCLP